MSQAQHFLTLLAGDEPVTFQTFDDGATKTPKLARILHGNLEEHAATLSALNAQGAGVFVMVNRGDGLGRKAANVTGIRALFVDLDGSPLEPVLICAIEPHLTIESSADRYHAYWLTDDCPLDRFTPLQAALAAKFNGDRVVKDLPRVMRLPGFWHQKGEPFQTRILNQNSVAPYPVEKIISALRLDLSPAAPAAAKPVSQNMQIPEGARNSTLASLAGSMRRKGMSFEAIHAALLLENTARCVPPLPESDVRDIAQSVGRYVPNDAASQPTYTRKALAAMIEATDDFDELTGRIAGLASKGDLRETERDALRKTIAKKANVSVASLKVDAKSCQQVSATRDRDHLSAARQVIAAFGDGNLIHAQSYLWRWDGSGVWRKQDDRETKQKIHAVSANAELTATVVGSILDLTKTEANRAGHKFDTEARTINCANGELELDEKGQWCLLPHDREHYHTAMLPVAYDPAATAPRFCLFLEEIFKGDPDSKEKGQIVLEAMGYTLIPDCFLEKFFMLIGAGANGKSVLLRVLAALVGREHVTAVQPSQFENRFQRAHLHGKLANIITEIAEGAEIADAQLKSLVSGETTTAEHKHRDPFDFTPYAKHWFGTNHLPHTRDFSDALFRRAIVLAFNNKFDGKQRDVRLAEKLLLELPGILNLALEGLKRLTQHRQFTTCASAEEITRQWRQEADQVAQFVEDACETGTACRATSAELYTRYQGWALDAGVRRQLNRNNFTGRLKRLGYEPDRGTGGTRMIAGVKPKLAMGGYGAVRS